MPKKIVDVYIDDELLISYPVSITFAGVTGSDQDFIQMAKENLIEDEYHPETIALATFKVRDDPEA
jgi:hypothetical protein